MQSELRVVKVAGDQASRHWPVNNLGQVHQAEVVVPANLAQTACGLRGCTYFSARCTLHDLTSSEFIENNLRGSHLSAVTTAPVDRCNSLAICPDGRLLIRLDRSTFEAMGLDGRKCPHSKDFYIVEIQLLAETFEPGKPCYERLRQVPTCTFDVIACRTAMGQPAAIQFPEGVEYQRHEAAVEQRPLGVVQTPVWDPAELWSRPADQLHQFAEAILEWAGELACGARGSCGVQDNDDGSFACICYMPIPELVVWQVCECVHV